MNGKLAYRHSLKKSATLISAIAVLLAIFQVGVAAAECSDRTGDRVLLVSTRPAGCSTNLQTIANRAVGYEKTTVGYRSQWIDQDPIELLSTLDPTLPTVVYVHGNQIDSCGARERGMAVYRRLTRAACDDRPIQFVIYSWNATKVPGLLRDYREKAARTRPIAAQLAWTLNRIPSGTQIGVIGYSYGARVLSGAAHLLGGGSLNGICLQESTTSHTMRAVFLAAAEDAYWLSPTSYHGNAMHQLDSLLVTINPKDPAMRFFKYLSKTSSPDALGGVGPRGLSSEASSRVRICNVSRSVGQSHDLHRYLAAPGLMRSTWQRLTFAEQQLPTVPTVAKLPGKSLQVSSTTK